MTRLPFLDALRGLAAVSVMLFHYSITARAHIDPAFPLFALGEWGVPLFFVISGYVIMMTATKG